MKILDNSQLIGEATEYDKKMALEVKKPKSWLKSVSAFANGEGGTLIFGISDDDQVVGLDDAVSGTGDRSVSHPFFSGYERDEAFLSAGH